MKTLYILLGFILLGLGIFGIYIPVLPTTPFLLLATACFANGSEKFNCWFLQTEIYKNNIEPLKKKEGMTIKKKLKIMSMITLFLGISFLVMSNIHGRICLVVVFLAHCYYFFVKVKTIE